MGSERLGADFDPIPIIGDRSPRTKSNNDQNAGVSTIEYTWTGKEWQNGTSNNRTLHQLTLLILVDQNSCKNPYRVIPLHAETHNGQD